MEVDAISLQARAAVDHLTEQLRSLEFVSSTPLFPPLPHIQHLPSSPSPATTASISTSLTTCLNRHEQTALLTSLQLTSSTLSTLPNYTTIAPTLSQIPHYETKLARLKAAMAQQQHDVAELKRRALEAGMKRRQNLSRIEEKRRGERERDRTVLRARVQSSVRDEQEAGEVQGEEEGVEVMDGSALSVDTTTVSEVSEMPPVASVVKTVKRKKKVRQADIQ